MNLFDKIGFFFMLCAIYAQVVAVTLYWPAVAVLFGGLLLMYWADYLDNVYWRWRQRRDYRHAHEALRAAGLERSEPDLFGGQWDDPDPMQYQMDCDAGPKE